ncbi:MAG TPA: DivIVA domain-containing protein [Gaiellaceae bacterium]|jgi:DivIVA domain-containing protein|nr:DivIVA domain-containing protein [Gaiellales bacterium]HYX88380.1 DivIVA domain-containing protein [Gaiellaceae bacterium]
MIDLASIRNASFTLTPTGYNPEEVDRFLADLADELEREPIETTVFETAAAPAPTLAPIEARPEADLDGLSGAIERAVGALDAFVQNELAAVRAASELEVDEIHRERERLLDEAADAARAHLDEAKVRAEAVADQIRADAEREAARIIRKAEERRGQADEMVAAAARVQASVLDSIESARAKLAASTELDPAPAQDARPFSSSQPVAAEPADPEADEVQDATDAAA